MDKLFALCAFLASLAGCDGGRDTVVHRLSDGHGNALLSRATIEAGSTRFECVRSSTGACHYLVLPRGCAPEHCAGERRFDVAAGDARQVAGLQSFRLCVDTAGGRPPAASCTASDALAN